MLIIASAWMMEQKGRDAMLTFISEMVPVVNNSDRTAIIGPVRA